jgi:hypothetical protein
VRNKVRDASRTANLAADSSRKCLQNKDLRHNTKAHIATAAPSQF